MSLCELTDVLTALLFYHFILSLMLTGWNGCIESPGKGGDSYMKQTGMLIVSLRGVNFGFWSRLGCSGQSANILSRQGLV